MKKQLTLLIGLFFCIAGASQTGDWYTYYNGGLCSTNILLLSDGTYKYESGCEASSRVSFGTWTQKKDTIECRQIDTKNFKILNISPSRTLNSKTLSVSILDQNGKNITASIRIKQYVQGKGTYTMTLDSSRAVRTDFIRVSGMVIIESLEKLNNEPFGFKVDSFTNFDLTLNIPSILVYNIGSNFINIGSFKLLKMKDKLLSVEIYSDDGNAKPYRLEYIKQKN